ncbi:AraC family transcriptional regulator [Hydrogenophaga sp.]|uniref:AraC family transcriptional regulator n=1 Tax=Hydrogenophaga sp. TaxID=1904254 RepID=UPI0035AFE29C
MTHLVRAAALTHYADVARSAGLDPWRMLADAGLPRACLADPELRISGEAVRELLERSAERSGVEAFGLLMAEGRRISNLGALGLLSREEPTLRLALQSFQRFGRVHNEALRQRIEEAEGLAVVREDLLFDEGGPMRQATELVVAVALRTMRVFLGNDWRARRICFTHQRPVDLSVHRRVLGQTPAFSQDFNGVVCLSTELDTPITSADPVVAGYIRRQLQTVTRGNVRVSDEVRQMALVLLPQGRCTIEEVARHMGVHRRTLHRQLGGEGHSFAALLQALRENLAQGYVADRQRTLTEVSQLLGFADLSSFSRWYRRSFGEPAQQTRSAAPTAR